jgi:hypothetical protein
MHRYLSQIAPNDWIFEGGTRTFGPLVNIALRTAAPNYSVRAIRRGALQALAEQGVPDEVLMVFSGHVRDTTLHGYLQWTKRSEARRERGFEAAQLLAPSGETRFPRQC